MPSTDRSHRRRLVQLVEHPTCFICGRVAFEVVEVHSLPVSLCRSCARRRKTAARLAACCVAAGRSDV